MATIQARKRDDGSTSYTATIRIKKAGMILHQESRTFSRQALAQDWAKRREVELEDDTVLALAKTPDVTVGALLKAYVAEYEGIQKWGKNKSGSLLMLQGLPIAKLSAASLTEKQVLQHVRERRTGGTGPATVLNDLIWLRVALRAMGATLGIPVALAAVESATATARRMGLIAKPQQRDRRPTPVEVQRLLTFFESRDLRADIPMAAVMRFAIASARREAEITRLAWADLDAANHVILVRDVKHPRKKQGNHKRAKLTAEALAIIQAQPKTGPLIFPYRSKSVSAAFTRACHVLAIDDLTFHDLRHEATSRLFEAGYGVDEVSLFTLHESWAQLKRYTHLKPEKMALR